MKINVPLSRREMSILLEWRSERNNWPDEKRILNTITEAHTNNEDLYLTPFQIGIVREWCEQELGGHYGGGIVTNLEEYSILKKLDYSKDKNKG